MKRYYILSRGYEPAPLAGDLEQARSSLRELVADSLAAAKRRSRQARKHKLGEDSYLITLGSDKRSALWASFSLLLA